jgi:lysophospholipase L1-like esterase
MRGYGSFVALGDSFTEGLGDLHAYDASCRGWADRFAEELAWHNPGVRYANLAIRGKRVSEVLAEQVPGAVAMAPDLVSLAAGGNDMLRVRTDPDELAATFETAVARLTSAGCKVMIFTGFDPTAFPILRLVRGKAAVFSMHIRGIAAKYDCLLADLWPMRTLTDRRLWSADRLHLSPDGHRRVALLACEVAGVPVRQDWRAPLAEQPEPAGFSRTARAWLASRWSDTQWMTEHAAPYFRRRLHGASSGDGMTAKRPWLAPLTVGVPAVSAPLTVGWREASVLGAESLVAESVAAGGVVVEPVVAEPVVAEPVVAEFVVAEPLAVERVQAEPLAVESVQAEPVAAEPATA